MAEIVITDNVMSASVRYPGATIISRIVDVLDLPLGTPVILYPVRIGPLAEGAVKTARILIDRGDLEEVGE